MILLYMGILQGREGLKQSNSFCLVNFLAGEEKLGGYAEGWSYHPVLVDLR